MADSYTFLPWVREGAVSTITSEDPLSDTLDSRVRMDVKVFLNNNTDQNSPDAKVTARLYGPGDVTGFDARQVIRTDPLHLISDFEPNYFPVVEFDRPDFPWMFTPARANNNEQLRPWICLVVVEKREDNLKADPTKPLPVLTANPKTELPDLSESWAWAHAQVSGEAKDETEMKRVLSNSPERTLSRLLCPRKLEPNKSYYACVVPTFDIGRKAGLGEEVKDGNNEDDATLKPAWGDKTTEIKLPVYYHWEFSTGGAGDFESLVWLLQRRPLSPEVSPGKMKVTQPAPLWPSDFEVPLEGALRPPEFPQKPIDTPKAFKNKLQKLLNAAENQQSSPILPAGLPIPPPIYGRWHAAQRTIPDGTRNVVWLRELNLNPSHRAVAGLGTQIVQDQQEQLMASAWEQVGEIEKANQGLRQAQLARSAGTMIYEQHLKKMPAETFIYVTGAAHVRVMTNPLNPWDRKTIYARVRDSVVPQATVQGPFRRLTRPRGPLARRMAAYGGLHTGQLIRRLNDKEIKVVPERRAPNGMVTMDRVFEKQHPDNADLQEKFCRIMERLVSMRLPDFQPSHYQEMWRAFRATAIEHQRTMEPCYREMPLQKPSLNLEQIKTTLLGVLDPNVSIVARFKARLVAPPDWKPEDPLEPIMVAPEFPQPMYKPLADLSQDFMLPGLEHIPPNTITLLETNPRFVEAFMVGLNHEMSRELLWREFPTDQRGTYFRQFWDSRGHVPPPSTPQEHEKLKDLKPIPEWDTGKALGGNMTGGSTTSQIVLLIRGDLLRRYPRAIIYAAEAKWVEAKDKDGKPLFDSQNNPVMIREPKELPLQPDPSNPAFPEKYPAFQGTLSPDMTFLGFDLDPTIAKGDQDPAEKKPGWFFVLQQPPTDPRYGLDETEPASDGVTGTWRDLSWSNLTLTDSKHLKLANPFIGNFTAPTTPVNVKWRVDSSSAALAFITLQGPFRVAIHASDLLPA